LGNSAVSFSRNVSKVLKVGWQMDQRSPIEGRYRFGPFLLDPAERQVSRDGAPVALTTRLFELLLAFVRSPGVLLTKSDLMDAVWPDRVVDEGSLTQAIFSLRKALEDNSEDGRYITTVTGRGYSFSAPVENIGAAPRTDASREALSPGPVLVQDAATTVAPSGARNPAYLYLAGALAIILAVAAFTFWPRAAPPAGKPLVVVVADFQNLSSNPLFDRTFTTAAKSALQQSPRLSVLSDGVIEDTLDLMTRSKDTRLTPQLAQEVCARNNGQAAIGGAIAQVGANYLLTLTATDCVNGEVISTDKAEVTSLDALLPTLDRLVEGVRQKLGESADSIEKFNVPILKQRTASFEALVAYSEAHYDFNHGKYVESIPLFQRAIEIDPTFAAAYDGLSTAYSNTHENKLDIVAITRAYALRDHASELEKLHIVMRYNFSVLGDIDETIRILKSWTELYPDDASAWANLTNQEVWLGEYAAAMRDGATRRQPEPRAWKPPMSSSQRLIFVRASWTLQPRSARNPCRGISMVSAPIGYCTRSRPCVAMLPACSTRSIGQAANPPNALCLWKPSSPNSGSGKFERASRHLLTRFAWARNWVCKTTWPRPMPGR
jgi:DNA-binding winged helix-turn-helix (wHTH) protein/tetratricopeptide (TPR) repeat protein